MTIDELIDKLIDVSSVHGGHQDVYVWDAYEGEHYDILGTSWYASDEPSGEYEGGFNPFAINIETRVV